MPPPPHLFFDAVGTLFHLHEPVGTTYARFAMTAGWTIDASACEAAFRKSIASIPPPLGGTGIAGERAWWKALVATTLKAAGSIPGAPLGDWFDGLFAHYASAAAWTLYPEVPAVLQHLRDRGHHLHVLSNFDHRLPSLLESLGLAAGFSTVTTSHAVGLRKPALGIFAAAQRAAGAAASSCLLVGDDPQTDGLGAKQAGWQFQWIQRPKTDMAVLLAKED